MIEENKVKKPTILIKIQAATVTKVDCGLVFVSE